MYGEGRGVPQNNTEANKWYKKASYGTTIDHVYLRAQLGNAFSQYLIGRRYLSGDGVKINYTEAFKWLKMSSDNGDCGGHYGVGVCYVYGCGVPVNYVKAYAYFNISAAENYRNAIRDLKLLAKKMTPTQIAEGQKLAEILLNKIPK